MSTTYAKIQKGWVSDKKARRPLPKLTPIDTKWHAEIVKIGLSRAAMDAYKDVCAYEVWERRGKIGPCPCPSPSKEVPEPVPPAIQDKVISTRDDLILKLYNDGASLGMIGERVGLQKCRLRRILHSRGVAKVYYHARYREAVPA